MSTINAHFMIENAFMGLVSAWPLSCRLSAMASTLMGHDHTQNLHKEKKKGFLYHRLPLHSSKLQRIFLIKIFIFFFKNKKYKNSSTCSGFLKLNGCCKLFPFYFLFYPFFLNHFQLLPMVEQRPIIDRDC